MIEVRIKCETEAQAYELASYCSLQKISTDVEVIKDVDSEEPCTHVVEFDENGFITQFINPKPERALPIMAIRQEKQIIDNHI